MQTDSYSKKAFYMANKIRPIWDAIIESQKSGPKKICFLADLT